MTDAALVTGASSGIGLAVAEKLLEMDYEVYGIGRDFSKAEIRDKRFHCSEFDLLHTEELLGYLKKLPKENLKVVINNAGCAYYGLHEEMNVEMIQKMIRTDLEVPEIIAGNLIRTLRKNRGWLMNISSVTALGSSTHAAAYGSAKAGLLHFSRTLFDENRKYGMKVCCIMPDLTESGLYRNAGFTTSDNREERLEPQDIASVVEYLLNLPEGVVMPEIVIRPQKNKIIRNENSFKCKK